MDTKITRLRNLLSPVKNYFALAEANKKSGGHNISVLQEVELENIIENKGEIFDIISQIPDDACEKRSDSLSAFDFKYISQDGFKKEQLVLAENEVMARAILVKHVNPKRIDSCHRMGKPLK